MTVLETGPSPAVLVAVTTTSHWPMGGRVLRRGFGDAEEVKLKTMNTKQLIEEEIELMDEEQLREIYQFIQRFSLPKERAAATGLMGRLKGVHIEAPEDYASNLDAYMSGEKRVA